MGRRERASDKKKQILISVILAAIMIFSAFGVMLGTVGNEMRYGKYKFEIQGNVYVTKINGQQMAFYSLPKQIEGINLSSVITNKLKEAYMITITFNPYDTNNIQLMEMVRFDLSQLLGKVVYNGVLNASEQYPDLPVLTCANATLKTPVIVLNMSDNTSIVDVDNCIYLNARGQDFLILRDRLLYSYYGVIQNE
ncbi:hypothetical protein JW756_05475 [Candidatus Woesearchaeota archaeon]|nr:hypothetical protein [Candidatus Woesearchaeota archaeon]